MTVPTTAAFTGPYFPNGVTTEYPFSFKVNSDSEVVVFFLEDDGTETIIPSANYTVALSVNDNVPGGTVTTAAPLPADLRPVFIALDPDFTQGTKFEDEGAFNQSILNPTFDAGALRSIWLRSRISRAFLVPFGEQGITLPRAAERQNKFISFDAAGAPILSAGTGADGGLRTDLANRTIGPALIGVGPNGRTLANSLSERHNARDFGAIGDGFAHPLSEFYASLATAQAEFPAATSLDNLIDGLAINKMLTVIANSALGRGHGYIPAGRYRGNTGSLLLPSSCTLEGDGAGQTIIDNQNTPVNYALLVNRDPAEILFSTLRGLSFHGGTKGIDFGGAGQTTGMVLDDVSMALNSVCSMEVGNLFQTSTLHRVYMDGTQVGRIGRGLFQSGAIANAITLQDCEIVGHALESLWLTSPENFRVIGGRIEGGGVAEANVTASIAAASNVLTVTAVANGTLRVGTLLIGANIAAGTVITALGTGVGGVGTYTVNNVQTAASAAVKGYTPTIRLDRARSMEIATYLEATHEYALVETDSRDGVTFDGTHFTGANVGAGFIPYKIQSNGIVNFGDNNHGSRTIGPDKALVRGNNTFFDTTAGRNLAVPLLGEPTAKARWESKTTFGGRGRGGRRNFGAALTFPAVVFRRNADSGVQEVSGTLKLHMFGLNGGGFARYRVKHVPFLVRLIEAQPAAFIQDNTKEAVFDDLASGFTIAFAQIAGATNNEVRVEAQCSGANAGPFSYAAVGIEFTSTTLNDVHAEVEFL